MIDPRFEEEAISILMEEALSETTEETKFDVERYIENSDFDWQQMNRYPTVNSIDFHMNSYPASIYSEIEQFCSENEFTVDYFLQEFAQQEQQLQRPFNAYRGKSPLNDV